MLNVLRDPSVPLKENCPASPKKISIFIRVAKFDILGDLFLKAV